VREYPSASDGERIRRPGAVRRGARTNRR